MTKVAAGSGSPLLLANFLIFLPLFRAATKNENPTISLINNKLASAA
jgi:hypothetical protein